MPVGKEPKWGIILDAIRDGVPATKAKFREWFDTCREEPGLFWQTPAIRYMTYGMLGLIGVLIVTTVANSCVPNIEIQEQATTTDHRVICTTPGCDHMFVIDRPFDFDSYPVLCPNCSKKMGQPALRCNSQTCRGKWVVRTIRNDRFVCPQCDADLGEVD